MTFRLLAIIMLLSSSGLAYSENVTKPTGKILYVGQDTAEGKGEIYTINADGSQQRQITHNREYNAEPARSPNGKLIAFTFDQQLYIINSDGTGQRKIANNGQAPTWSPDSKSIAFHSYQTGNWEIFVINADGTNLRNITNSPRTETYPDWSPDGKSIAFHTTRAGKDNTYRSNWEIYKMNPNGTNPTRLTTTKALNWFPAWSPDGKTLAFWSDRDGKWNIYLIDSDGSNLRQLTYNRATGNTLTHLTWSPDGNNLAFMASQIDGWEMRIINIQDKNITKIFTNHKFNRDFQWLK